MAALKETHKIVVAGTPVGGASWGGARARGLLIYSYTNSKLISMAEIAQNRRTEVDTPARVRNAKGG